MEEVTLKQFPDELIFCEVGCKTESTVTKWKAIYIAGFVAFLAAVEGTVVGMAEWPYMHTIDPEATVAFFGLANSIAKWGRVIFSLVFSFYTYKAHSVRSPLILGRILAFIGCCIYLCVEYIPVGRRYLMLFCYVVFSIAGSSTVILRVYLVLISSNEDRPRAFAAMSLAAISSVIIGPVIQLIFSGISYPGIQILPNLSFHIYSAPIWLASVLSLLSVFFIHYYMEEMPDSCKTTELENSFDYTLEAVKNRIQRIRSLNVPWALIFLCLTEKLIFGLTPGTLSTVITPLEMTTFGWDAEYTVKVSSISMVAVGFLAFFVGFLFMATNFPVWIPSRICIFIGLCVAAVLYLSTYPYPTTSRPLPLYNATTRIGCNPLEYSWCETAKGTYAIIFLPIAVVLIGLGIPMAYISIDTIYSKLASNADQSLMQGLIVVTEDIMMIVSPVYAATMFTSFGQGPLWISNGVITVVGIIAWFLFLPQLKRY